jgi:hypothetical protein
MNSVNELIKKINTDLQTVEMEDKELKDPQYVADVIQFLALEKIPAYVPADQLETFFNASEQNFKESTFKKFIPDYEQFLRELESDFRASVMLGDMELDEEET